jgi:hypothetical protein
LIKKKKQKKKKQLRRLGEWVNERAKKRRGGGTVSTEGAQSSFYT